MRQCSPHLPVWPYGERLLATLTQAAQLAQDIMGSWPGQRPPLKSFSGDLANDPLDPMSCFLSPQEGEAEDSMPAAHAERMHSPRCGSEARARATGGALVPSGSHTAQHNALATFSQFSVSARLSVKDRRPTPPN